MQLVSEELPVLEANRASATEEIRSGVILKTPDQLADIVSQFSSSSGWLDRVRLRTVHRWYERLYHGPDYDIWAISWMPGQSTGFHDHGDSAGAFVVATGTLQEHRPGESAFVVQPGELRAFGPNYAHDVRNASLAPAISIHAYSPPLSEMNEYELDGDQLVPREGLPGSPDRLSREAYTKGQKPASPAGASSIEQILSASRARLRRLSPHEAHEAGKTGALLVDIRPEGQRAIEGSIPGALIVERNVLEWRFDPTSNSRLPIATDHNLQVIVFCSEGYTSSLAAASLQDLGLLCATDIVGGFQAWRAAGLPIEPSASEQSRSVSAQIG
jgi:rhodanese-related sulfurtransferase/mannose-6-phosphate isomerase-like protein (cupin superfamily)